MELTKILNYDSFDPTPKLKSSPVPISFVSFNEYDRNCIHCGDEYAKTACNQRYCKKCLSYYLDNITDNNLYLDVYILTENFKCSEHEISMTNELQNIQECCRNCFGIFCFKQISNRKYLWSSDPFYNSFINMIRSEKNCNLCGKSISQKPNNNYHFYVKLCSNCYLISSECIKSTLTKKPVTILYLPWWLNIIYCESCEYSLKFTSNCQKYCENCFTFYIGCRYCLTTNIVFGITNQSQCKKCKRVSSIIFNVTKISSGNSDLDDFLNNSRLEIYNQLNLAEIKNFDNYFIAHRLLDSNYYINRVETLVEWIPYSQFTNVKEIAKGGFGIIYLAYRRKVRRRINFEPVILKKFKNSRY